jgi:hypothetical protein
VLEPKLGQNTELDNLIKQLQERQKIADNLKTGLDTPAPRIDDSAGKLDDELARAEKEAEIKSKLNKSISDIKAYMQTGDWAKLGWTPTVINPYKKEMMEWFNLKISKLESGELTVDSIMKDVKDELSAVVKKKKIKDLTKSEKDGYWVFRSLRGDKGGFWSSPVGIAGMLGIGYALYSGGAILFASDFYKNNVEAIDEINKEDGSKTSDDVYDAIIKDDPNLEGLTIDDKTWKMLEKDENGVETYTGTMSNGDEYTFQWDGNVWTIL